MTGALHHEEATGWRRRMRRPPVLASAALLLVAPACAGSGGLLSASGSDSATVVSGLKEALRVGTQNAVERTSRVDGFLGDPRIRLELPEALQPMATGLRAIGLGARVDELELAMNRAAEQAAGEAASVFWDGIRAMTFADARGILQGGDTAATDYFDRTTREPLRQRFEPIVGEKMSQVGLARLYDDLVARYTALPFTKGPALDMRSYVTEKALDGLFHVLAEEERKIRVDPAARVTPLLKQVFGS